jgi:hypothetical protein
MNNLLLFLCSKVNIYKYGDGTNLKYHLWYSNSLSIEVKQCNGNNGNTTV